MRSGRKRARPPSMWISAQKKSWSCRAGDAVRHAHVAQVTAGAAGGDMACIIEVWLPTASTTPCAPYPPVSLDLRGALVATSTSAPNSIKRHLVLCDGVGDDFQPQGLTAMYPRRR